MVSVTGTNFPSRHLTSDILLRYSWADFALFCCLDLLCCLIVSKSDVRFGGGGDPSRRIDLPFRFRPVDTGVDIFSTLTV